MQEQGSGGSEGAASTLDVALIREFALDQMEKARLKAELSAVQKRLTVLEETVRNAMIDAGVVKQTVIVGDNKVLVHMWSQQRARRKPEYTKDEVARVLIEVGMPELTSFGYEWNTLDSWAREQAEADPTLSTIPQKLRDMLDIYEHHEARTRKG